jgi:tyrosyl-tRNA synthetase
MTKNFFNELKWRGFLHSHSNGVEEHLHNKRTAYIGFDPTAPSLHVGSLLPIMGLVHFQRCGHTPIAVAGGGTGMVGDPSGKTQERKLLSKEEIDVNLEGIKKQLAHFLDFTSKINPAKLVNNAKWLTKLSFMDFLRDIGKHFSVNEMMAKESVKNRLHQQQGISFTEFSYSLLQAYDFLELHDRYGCTLQMGGSDQWGNIVSGIDLIRRVRGAEAHGIVFPLITTSSGVKFGKTEGGTIWLDPSRTSPYKFYQFWYNTDDRDVVQYLKFFTLLSENKIKEFEELSKSSPEKREAQTALAQEVTRIVHGESALIQAIKASKIFFGGEITDVNDSELLDIFSDVPSTEISKEQLSGQGMSLVDLLVKATVVSSKSEARRLIQSGGVYLNNRRAAELEKKVTINDALHGKFVVLRKGAKSYCLVRLF